MSIVWATTSVVYGTLEEAGIPHPDNMLPNGKIMKSL